MDGDVQVNENQELLDDWKTPEKNLQILWEEVHDLTAGHGTGKVAGRGPWEGIICAYQFDSIWFIVYGVVNPKGQKSGPGFASAPEAFNTILKRVWDSLIEAGV